MEWRAGCAKRTIVPRDKNEWEGVSKAMSLCGRRGGIKKKKPKRRSKDRGLDCWRNG